MDIVINAIMTLGGISFLGIVLDEFMKTL